MLRVITPSGSQRRFDFAQLNWWDGYRACCQKRVLGSAENSEQSLLLHGTRADIFNKIIQTSKIIKTRVEAQFGFGSLGTLWNTQSRNAQPKTQYQQKKINLQRTWESTCRPSCERCMLERSLGRAFGVGAWLMLLLKPRSRPLKLSISVSICCRPNKSATSTRNRTSKHWGIKIYITSEWNNSTIPRNDCMEPDDILVSTNNLHLGTPCRWLVLFTHETVLMLHLWFRHVTKHITQHLIGNAGSLLKRCSQFSSFIEATEISLKCVCDPICDSSWQTFQKAYERSKHTVIWGQISDVYSDKYESRQETTTHCGTGWDKITLNVDLALWIRQTHTISAKAWSISQLGLSNLNHQIYFDNKTTRKALISKFCVKWVQCSDKRYTEFVCRTPSSVADSHRKKIYLLYNRFFRRWLVCHALIRVLHKTMEHSYHNIVIVRFYLLRKLSSEIIIAQNWNLQNFSLMWIRSMHAHLHTIDGSSVTLSKTDTLTFTPRVLNKPSFGILYGLLLKIARFPNKILVNDRINCG